MSNHTSNSGDRTSVENFSFRDSAASQAAYWADCGDLGSILYSVMKLTRGSVRCCPGAVRYCGDETTAAAVPD